MERKRVSRVIMILALLGLYLVFSNGNSFANFPISSSEPPTWNEFSAPKLADTGSLLTDATMPMISYDLKDGVGRLFWVEEGWEGEGYTYGLLSRKISDSSTPWQLGEVEYIYMSSDYKVYEYDQVTSPDGEGVIVYSLGIPYGYYAEELWATYNGGSGWTEPVRLDDGMGPIYEPKVKWGPDRWLACFIQHYGSARLYARFSTNGTTWSSPQNISGVQDDISDVDVGILPGGKFIVIYRQSEAEIWNLYAIIYNGSSWGSPQRIDAATGYNVSSDPVLCTDFAGNAMVVFRQSDGTNTRAWWTYFNGTSWSSPQKIDVGVGTGGVYSAGFKFGPLGDGYATFVKGGSPKRAWVSRFDNITMTFSSPVAVSSLAHDVWEAWPFVTPLGGWGVLYMAYYESYHLYYTRLVGSSWSAPEQVDHLSYHVESSDQNFSGFGRGAICYTQYDETEYRRLFVRSLGFYPYQTISSTLAIHVWGDGTMALQMNGEDQTYGGIDSPSKGSALFISGLRFGSTSRNPETGGEGTFDLSSEFSQLSNVKVGSNTIVTHYIAGNSALIRQETRKVTDESYRMTWNITNWAGSSLSDMKFFHGEDTYFAGQDDGAGMWSPGSNMVSIKKSGVYGSMGLFGITPATSFYEDLYYLVTDAVRNGSLPNAVNSSEVDAGYALGWARSSLAPAATWTIEAGEYVHIASAPESTSANISQGSDQSSYTMVSFSVLPNPSLRSHFEASLGSCDSTKWRAFAWDEENQYYVELCSSEWPSSFDHTWGRGYFVIVRHGGTVNITGSKFPGKLYSVVLKPGWNLIGNPFSVQVPLGSLYVQQEGGERIPLTSGSNNLTTTYIKIWQNGTYVEASAMDVGRAYWIKNKTGSDLVLIMNIEEQAGSILNRLFRFARGIPTMVASVFSRNAVASDDDPPPPPPGISRSVGGSSSSSGGGGGGCGTIRSRGKNSPGGDATLALMLILLPVFLIRIMKRRAQRAEATHRISN